MLNETALCVTGNQVARLPERVTSDKAHVEHNESAFTLIADIPADMTFRCNGPRTDLGALFVGLVFSEESAWHYVGGPKSSVALSLGS